MVLVCKCCFGILPRLKYRALKIANKQLMDFAPGLAFAADHSGYCCVAYGKIVVKVIKKRILRVGVFRVGIA